MLLLLLRKIYCLNHSARQHQHRLNDERWNAEHDHFVEVIQAEILGFEPDC